jgi:hypothetical protein
MTQIIPGTIEWAISALKNNRTVTRRSWGDPARTLDMKDGIPFKDGVPYEVAGSDITANDWELAYSEGYGEPEVRALKVGDVVALKGGSPRLTITELDEDDDCCTVTLFGDDGEVPFIDRTLPLAALVLFGGRPWSPTTMEDIGDKIEALGVRLISIMDASNRAGRDEAAPAVT